MRFAEAVREHLVDLIHERVVIVWSTAEVTELIGPPPVSNANPLHERRSALESQTLGVVYHG